MRVLIADKLPAAGVRAIAALGIEVIDKPGLDAAGLPAALVETEAEVLVVRSTKVAAECFTAAPRLGLVVRAGAGVNTIDVAAANLHGVFVTNCPGKNAIAVAELTLGLVLALDRSLVDAVLEMRRGSWNKKRFGQGGGLHGRRFGLVGFGHIGREVAARAQAFGMHVEVFDPGLDDGTATLLEVTRAADLHALLRSCDVISVHVPYGKHTHHLIGGRELAMLKDGAILIHTARGGVVDDTALAEAVRSGRIRAALDVFEDEPAGSEATFASPVRELAGLYATPHIGASTAQAELATAEEVVRIIDDYLRTGNVRAAVNLERDRAAHYTVVVRHRDRVGVLAGILGGLREEQLNVQEMSNVVFQGSETACATIALENQPSAALLERLRAQPDVLAVDLRAMP
ncbi:MAG: hydroxyacid dehydrogenase [Deltaproteobacteria bacterium]|nr:hydroxyacid dehydrogenase [Deltaproteobacteria bacterium]MBK8238466.1 hydroxyacid dehydrogenase [Deltaproteobacteria bacterium]MBK8717293.1 hydroxyacid dehydrogenase [Deltaproteobacteria bacterium]MBP7286161.1 hydroxyacid dehydrogenase [Nannocystaceae bacterium]